MRTCLLVAVLLLAGCKKSGAPESGVELVYRADGLTPATAETVNKRLASLGVRGVAKLENEELKVRFDGTDAQRVKTNLATGGKLEFFGVDDSTSKKLCGASEADGVALEQETLRDGSITCFFRGPEAAVRASAIQILGSQLRLQQLSPGEFRSFALAASPFL